MHTKVYNNLTESFLEFEGERRAIFHIYLLEISPACIVTTVQSCVARRVVSQSSRGVEKRVANGVQKA